MNRKEKQGVLAGVIIIIAVAAVVVYAAMTARPLAWQADGPPLSSNGTQDTEPFTMNNTWRVAWMTQQFDPMFILAVYIKNDVGGYSWIADVGEEVTNTTQGILPMPYVGTFVIRVIASNETQWTILIEEPKPT